MKKYAVILAVVFLLAACGSQETFETVADAYQIPAAAAAPGTISINIPENAASPVFSGEEGILYQCDGYDISVLTLESGDLDRTLRSVTGYGRENIAVISTQDGNLTRYDCAWTAVGEGGELVSRTMILDDGNYHYAVTATADAGSTRELVPAWKDIFDSVHLDSY